MTTTTTAGVSIDRKTLVNALEKVGRVVPTHTTKPILHCVRIEAKAGELSIAGTDLEASLLLRVPADGLLRRCLVNGRELLRRVRISKTPSCDLAVEDDVLVVNGGSVEHRLPTEPPGEYPMIPTRPEGKRVVVPAQQFRESSAITLTAVARETTRYAINGVLCWRSRTELDWWPRMAADWWSPSWTRPTRRMAHSR